MSHVAYVVFSFYSVQNAFLCLDTFSLTWGLLFQNIWGFSSLIHHIQRIQSALLLFFKNYSGLYRPWIWAILSLWGKICIMLLGGVSHKCQLGQSCWCVFECSVSSLTFSTSFINTKEKSAEVSKYCGFVYFSLQYQFWLNVF